MKTLRAALIVAAMAAWVPMGEAESQQIERRVSVSPVSRAKLYLDGMVMSADEIRMVQAANQPRNIRLNFHLIEANGFQTVDPVIADVVEELRGLFRFEGYRLLATSLLTGVLDEHASAVRQRIAVEEMNPLEIQAVIMRSANAETARIEVELSDVYSSYGLMSVSINVRDGQTVVLGSGRPDGARGTLILVMSADMEPYD
jgi:hypothetical protein